MKSYELLREALRERGPKVVADEMGLSVSMIYKWAEEPGEMGSGAVNPLDRVLALMRAVDDPALIHWLCENLGGFYLHNPEHRPPETDDALPAANRIVQEFADMIVELLEASRDNRILPEESLRIRSQWQSLKSVMEGFVVACEEGNFDSIREGMKRGAAEAEALKKR